MIRAGGEVEKIKVDRWRVCDKRNKGDWQPEHLQGDMKKSEAEIK